MSDAAESKPASTPALIHPLSLLKRFWLLIVLAVIAAGYGAYTFRWMWVDQGYAPDQPIAYSHKVHAGDLKIDCKYCHFNAERGTFAGVPPMSVCLGCHRQVATDRPEIQKLLAIADTGSYKSEDGVVHEGGVVHWNRVHRLPDHVYFSHEWHTKAGVACQTCHGPVEEMTKVRQVSDLTMAWCLECHRRTNYVGGREQVADKPETFTVGTGDYQAQTKRQDPDPVVVWHERQLKGKDPHAEPQAATGHGAMPQHVSDVEPHAERLAKLIASKPALKDLPRWRLADLPETHKVLYGEVHLANAPTQCSTCHQ